MLLMHHIVIFTPKNILLYISGENSFVSFNNEICVGRNLVLNLVRLREFHARDIKMMSTCTLQLLNFLFGASNWPIISSNLMNFTHNKWHNQYLNLGKIGWILESQLQQTYRFLKQFIWVPLPNAWQKVWMLQVLSDDLIKRCPM